MSEEAMANLCTGYLVSKWQVSAIGSSMRIVHCRMTVSQFDTQTGEQKRVQVYIYLVNTHQLELLVGTEYRIGRSLDCWHRMPSSPLGHRSSGR